MFHARTDYARIQDPLANDGLLAAYDNAMDVVAHAPSTAAAAQEADDRIRRTDKPRELFKVHQGVVRVLSTLCRHLNPTLGMLAGPSARKVGTPIAEEEPVFLLRAQDSSAPLAVEKWADMQRDEAIRKTAFAHAETMRRWQRDNGSKEADA